MTTSLFSVVYPKAQFWALFNDICIKFNYSIFAEDINILNQPHMSAISFYTVTLNLS